MIKENMYLIGNSGTYQVAEAEMNILYLGQVPYIFGYASTEIIIPQ